MRLIEERTAGPEPGPAVRGTRRATTGSRRRHLVVAGAVLLAVGLGAIGYVGWQLIGTNLVARHQHGVVKDEIQRDWEADGLTGDAAEDGWDAGRGVALVRIPRFGDDYEMPLLVGTDDDVLARGIGWFEDSARPGRIGNFAVAAHRVTHGEPFSRFLELRSGDEVIVETRTHVYTYRLTDDGDARVVDFEESWVLDPVPGHPGAEPEDRLLTMVTCSEIFHTDNRNVVFGVLQTAQRKSH